MKKSLITLFLCLLVFNNFAQTPFKTYSKFDFVQGEKVIVQEDFMQDALGDFPARWNTNGTGQVIKIEGFPENWLQINNNTIAFPDFVKELPENFTLEFSVAARSTADVNYTLHWLNVIFTPNNEPQKIFSNNATSKVETSFFPLKTQGKNSITIYDAFRKKVMTNVSSTAKFTLQKPMVKVAIWRQKTRIRVYLDDEKVWDIPQAFDPLSNYKKIVFSVSKGSPQQLTSVFFITNIRLAVGSPDTRNKLLSEGKFVTTGILFDSNSAQIKPESYGVLKEIAQVLLENTSLRIKIIGHTDSDGNDNTNLDLSKRRAMAVKNILSTEFNIEANRLETDGKGESQPITTNTSQEGKANNRRVEFIKL